MVAVIVAHQDEVRPRKRGVRPGAKDRVIVNHQAVPTHDEARVVYWMKSHRSVFRDEIVAGQNRGAVELMRAIKRGGAVTCPRIGVLWRIGAESSDCIPGEC